MDQYYGEVESVLDSLLVLLQMIFVQELEHNYQILLVKIIIMLVVHFWISIPFLATLHLQLEMSHPILFWFVLGSFLQLRISLSITINH